MSLCCLVTFELHQACEGLQMYKKLDAAIQSDQSLHLHLQNNISKMKEFCKKMLAEFHPNCDHCAEHFAKIKSTLEDGSLHLLEY